MSDSARLRTDALRIWQAGVEAVSADRLVREHLRVDGSTLLVEDEPFDLGDVGRIAVVGAGKAGAGMAAGVEQVLGPSLISDKRLGGWINVPADCVGGTGTGGGVSHIHLHAGRPAGVNQPRPEGVLGTDEILRLVESLEPDDLCLCLLSGVGRR